MLTFLPFRVKDSRFRLRSIKIHMRNHRLRKLPTADRTLEAIYDRFAFSQAKKTLQEARRLAIDVSYGPAGRAMQIAGHDARIYDLGPEVAPDDIDGRSPAIVTWHDGAMFYLIASYELCCETLVEVAASLYETRLQ
jgi:hypothetical protein